MKFNQYIIEYMKMLLTKDAKLHILELAQNLMRNPENCKSIQKLDISNIKLSFHQLLHCWILMKVLGN